MKDIKAGIISYIPSKTLKNFKSILSEKSYMFDEANKNSHYRNSDNYEKDMFYPNLIGRIKIIETRYLKNRCS